MVLIILTGPPAVGKMAVGIELQKLLGYKLFLNHDSIELVLKFFEYGSEKFRKLDDTIRKLIFEEVASSDLKGLIFTFVTAMTEESDKTFLEELTNFFNLNGRIVYYVELEADLTERLKRNRSKSRIEAKPSKRDLKASEQGLLSMEKKWIMNSTKEYPFFFSSNYIKIDNTNLTSKDVALKIIKEFDLR